MPRTKNLPGERGVSSTDALDFSAPLFASSQMGVGKCSTSFLAVQFCNANGVEVTSFTPASKLVGRVALANTKALPIEVCLKIWGISLVS